MKAVLHLIQNDKIKAAHDCSKGGLAIATCELAVTSKIGCNVMLGNIPQEKLSVSKLLFSESHSRYLLVIKKSNLDAVVDYLKKNKIEFGLIGKFEGSNITFSENNKSVAKLRVDKAHDKWFNSLRELVLHG
jgi:phosphoribosylformylglycinamidine synthase